MPKRTDIKSIFVIGSGPIIIGQACEFDYSGTQAIKALKEEGYRVILANSNPATIMTDPQLADATYIEPLTVEYLEKIIEKERPDAILPTLGGQTALNLTMFLYEKGVLDKYNVKLIGANINAIKKGEDRELFKKAMLNIGLEVPKSGLATNLKEAFDVIKDIGFPAIIRPAFTLGGTGGGIAYNIEEYEQVVKNGLDLSPVSQVLIEESVLGWKEFELEVMRDRMDNVVIICSIENFDPMGVHTGDSITVAPAQTLTDKEYQIMRDAAIKIIREIGVDTGGSNIQFAINPENGRMVVIEMNPRVSRSSALASKATGYPIAKIAAKLAVGYTLDEIKNDITKETPASFEPAIDYVVVKIPRFAFEKFPKTNPTLGTQMKSVGEVMAIGRTFKESLQKAIRSLEIGSYGFDEKIKGGSPEDRQAIIEEKLRTPNSERLWYIGEAFRMNYSIERIYELSKIDPWFLKNIKEIIDFEEYLKEFVRDRDFDISKLDSNLLEEAKRLGFSDRRLAKLLGIDELKVRNYREEKGVRPIYKMVDTCAAEFRAKTPYLYSTYEEEDEALPTEKEKIIILGGGPNRIGQGIEFDYCCVHAAFAVKEEGLEAIMINCNPETVSTDYDTSDRLYFEPLTFEDVLNIIEREKPKGIIVQFGGQTPLKLAVPLEKAGVNILGTSPDSIDRAEDRERFREVLLNLGLKQAESGIARSEEEAIMIAEKIGYPVMVRPSYVLGGRAMEIVYDRKNLIRYITEAVRASEEHPVLIDKFLKDAIEVDVDAISDGEIVVVGGVMEHIEEAGVHSGDSACIIPPYSLKEDIINELIRQTKLLARELNVIGLINIQFAIKDEDIYILEVNPRASRTVPFVSKAIGVPLAKLALKCMLGKSLKELGFTKEIVPKFFSAKEAVFPFIKFPGVDTILGPEMKSTGEVMGIDRTPYLAFAKSQISAGNSIPLSGTVFISVKDEDKPQILDIARLLKTYGFKLICTAGTSKYLKDKGIDNERVLKVIEGRPNIVDKIKNKEVNLIINTTFGQKEIEDSYLIRRSALENGIPYFTTISAAKIASYSIPELLKTKITVSSLQDYHKLLGG
ncbi:MAG: carbamoyl-phosphate synthase large subunit [Proteobacteria bacterium]|nr:carbamoyl-phosphate synthase large subunit [Pseudomonadota bacterium]